MDRGSPTTRFSSYARACRRLAGEVASFSATAGEPAISAAAGLLREASDRFVALAGARAARLPEWLVQNALTDLLGPDAAAADAAEATPALRATGDFSSTADLVSFLAVGRRSGRLEVTTASERFLIVLDDGDIVHAQSDQAPRGQRLGDLLVAAGAVTAADIEATIASGGELPLGRVLWDRGLVTREELLAALEQQIGLQFARMFELPPLGFVFWAAPPSADDHEVRLNATGLILDGARAADERTRGA